MAGGTNDDLARGLAALRAAVLEALLPARRPLLDGVLLTEAAPSQPEPASGPGPNRYGDAGLAASSEESDADKTRLIGLVAAAVTGAASGAVTVGMALRGRRPSGG